MRKTFLKNVVHRAVLQRQLGLFYCCQAVAVVSQWQQLYAHQDAAFPHVTVTDRPILTDSTSSPTENTPLSRAVSVHLPTHIVHYCLFRRESENISK